ncbi:MAG: hypothetical protein ABR520_09660 [Mycobacteriales bacterium]|nr:hypothetical protein [Frankia sp.]
MSESDDGSRIEAAEAGMKHEQAEIDQTGAAVPHVTATDAAPTLGHDTPQGDDDHGGHHVADPNAGVVVGVPPTPAWVMTAVGIGIVTLLLTVLLGYAMRDVDGGTGPAPDEGHPSPVATAER